MVAGVGAPSMLLIYRLLWLSPGLFEKKPPVPPVKFKDATISSNAFSLVWNSLAGVNYEVQVTTNLFPADWETLASIAAGTNVCSFMDTNIVNGVCSRFYRLVLVP